YQPARDTREKRLKLNPLLIKDSAEARNFWAEWLWTLMTYQNEALSMDEVAALRQQADRIAAMPQEKRRLYHVALDLHEHGHTRLGQLLMPWSGEGYLAYLFDHEEDTLTMDNRVHGFDMAEIIREAEGLKPLLLYLLLRVHMSLDGKPAMIV